MITKFKIYEGLNRHYASSGEYEYEEIVRTIEELNLEWFPMELKAYFNDADEKYVNEYYLKKIENCDYNDVNTEEDVKAKLIEYDRYPENYDRIVNEIKNDIWYAPLILIVNNKPYLVAGNTRIMVAKILNYPIHIKEVVYREPSNYTDGRFKRGDYVYCNLCFSFNRSNILLEKDVKYLVLKVNKNGGFIFIMDEFGKIDKFEKSKFETEAEHDAKKYNL